MRSTPVQYPATHNVLAAPRDSDSAAVPILSCVISTQLDAEDRQALLDLFARSTAQTRRDRFHHALSVFPERYLEEILHGEQLALVARDSCHPDRYGAVIGLASAAPMTEQAAEVAVWVDDAWQRRGVGGLLLREILALLPQQGYAEAVGFVEPSNIPARRLIERISPNSTKELHGDIIEVRMPLSRAQRVDRQETSRRGSAPVAT
jgi:ribosomal protein S18 acetylase RimI-like enzyme